jgi:hypothetical protein
VITKLYELFPLFIIESFSTKPPILTTSLMVESEFISSDGVKKKTKFFLELNNINKIALLKKISEKRISNRR